VVSKSGATKVGGTPRGGPTSTVGKSATRTSFNSQRMQELAKPKVAQEIASKKRDLKGKDDSAG
jgi:hypothetical protein